MIELSFNLPDMQLQLDLAEKTIEGMAEKTFKTAVEVFKENVVRWTPVGNPALWKHPEYVSPFYEPGTLKAAWTLNFDTSAQATLANYTPYAQRVEDGWSSQAPNGMLKRAVVYWPSIVDSAANEINRK